MSSQVFRDATLGDDRGESFEEGYFERIPEQQGGAFHRRDVQERDADDTPAKETNGDEEETNGDEEEGHGQYYDSLDDVIDLTGAVLDPTGMLDDES